MHELPNLAQLTSEQKDELIRTLFEQVLTLSARVEQLLARWSKDSHNSSKPPSSDGLSKKPKSLRRASGRKRGGQQGHDGSTLERVAIPDVVMQHPLPPVCDDCGGTLALDQALLTDERRQVFDLPRVRYEVTEHRVLEVRCACGKWHRSQFPQSVPNLVQYGPALKAAAVYLTQYQLLPMERTTELLDDLYGLRLSVGTVHASIAQAAQALAPTVVGIAAAVQSAPVAHFDETGQRVGGRLRWLHAAVTATLTWYGAHDKRGQAAMDAFGILPGFKGVAVHDGWVPYKDYDCTHGLCNAHHLRELVFLAETTGQAWPQQMIDLLCAAKTEVEQARGANAVGVGQAPLALSAQRLRHYRKRYEAILAAGERLNPEALRIAGRRGRVKQSTAANLLGRLRRYSDDVLRFLYDLRVPFDNNQAERDIRMPKLKQKVSGCFRTTQGADAFCITRSYLATMRKQGRYLFHSLILTFQGQPPQPTLSG